MALLFLWDPNHSRHYFMNNQSHHYIAALPVEKIYLPSKEKNRANHVVSRTPQSENETMDYSIKTGNNTLALLKTSAMMETSEKIIQEGNQQRHAKVCKVCGKEGQATDLKRHIEASHLEEVSVPCNLCDKILRTREALRKHKKSDH